MTQFGSLLASSSIGDWTAQLMQNEAPSLVIDSLI